MWQCGFNQTQTSNCSLLPLLASAEETVMVARTPFPLFQFGFKLSMMMSVVTTCSNTQVQC